MTPENKDRRLTETTPEIEAWVMMSDVLEEVATKLCLKYPDQSGEDIKSLIQTAFDKNIRQIDVYVDEVRAIERQKAEERKSRL